MQNESFLVSHCCHTHDKLATSMICMYDSGMRYCCCRCGGMSNSLREQLKEHYNASQQAAIASVMCPGQALFSLLQVGIFLYLTYNSLYMYKCVQQHTYVCSAHVCHHVMSSAALYWHKFVHVHVHDNTHVCDMRSYVMTSCHHLHIAIIDSLPLACWLVHTRVMYMYINVMGTNAVVITSYCIYEP